MSETVEERGSFRALFHPSRRAFVLAGLGASFIASFDILIVVTALPSAARDLDGTELYALAAGAYSVSSVFGMPVGGSLTDRFGPYRTLMLGGGIFLAGTIVAALAPSIAVVAIGRLVQGLGGGAMLAVPLVIWNLYLPRALIGHAFGINAGVWGISALLGPPAGALLTGTLGWRYVFWVNLPLLALMFALAHAGLRDRARPTGPHPRVNVVGPLLLGAVVLALLTEPLLAIPAVLAFAWVEIRSHQPVVPRHASGRAACLLSFTAGAAFLGTEAFLPLDLQSGLGWSLAWSALPLIGSTGGWTTGSMLMARVDWSLRRTIGVGSGIVAAATLLMAVPSDGGVIAGIGFALAGLGMGIASPALFGAVLSDTEGEEGRESASIPTARLIGGGVGVAIAGAIVVALASQATLDAADDGIAPLPDLHEAARVGYLVLGLLVAASLPAVRALRLHRRPGR